MWVFPASLVTPAVTWNGRLWKGRWLQEGQHLTGHQRLCPKGEVSSPPQRPAGQDTKPGFKTQVPPRGLQSPGVLSRSPVSQRLRGTWTGFKSQD